MKSPSDADVVLEDADDKTAARGMELGSVQGRLARASRPVNICPYVASHHQWRAKLSVLYLKSNLDFV